MMLRHLVTELLRGSQLPRHRVAILAILCLAAFAGDNGLAAPTIREIETFDEFSEHRTSLNGLVVQGIDFKSHHVNWEKLNVRGTVFLGCRFRSNNQLKLLWRGAVIFPELSDLPYNPYRSELYTPGETGVSCRLTSFLHRLSSAPQERKKALATKSGREPHDLAREPNCPPSQVASGSLKPCPYRAPSHHGHYV